VPQSPASRNAVPELVEGTNKKMRHLFFIASFLFAISAFSFANSVPNDSLKKVCSDYKKRKLLLDCAIRLHPEEFLHMCSEAKNEKVQNTLLHYNKTKKHRNDFRTAAIIFGAGAGLIYIVGGLTYIEAVGTNNKLQENSAATLIIGGNFVFCGSLTFTILSATKNFKRKKLLYKELPEAYNFYVQGH
jgi:hypothetical protein